jgi:hypothetical protein
MLLTESSAVFATVRDGFRAYNDMAGRGYRALTATTDERFAVEQNPRSE